MSSHAHVQLWRATPHKGDDKRFISYMEGLSDAERYERKQKNKKKRQKTGPANRLSHRMTEKMHKAAEVLKEKEFITLGELGREVGVEPGKLSRAMMNAVHLYLFFEENIGGRVYVGLFKEMHNDREPDSK